jgi:hypothetical protein
MEQKQQALADEWSLLQNQFDSYEKFSLLIKLSSTAMLGAALLINHPSIFVLFLLATLWLQDAIWKTFQARIESRLLQLERSLVAGTQEAAYQFNSQYLLSRPGVVGLLKEYFVQALRPTVAFPHALLILILGIALLP